ncbi:hypothetical protein BZA77DRAFT_75417 [Pyronema omphalodes]|nr:hypothetical protein BZA77DRAFT_75417 [Pyronema omphalodes]
MQIPTVTPEDLAAFHHTHLCPTSSAACSTLCGTNAAGATGDDYYEYYDEEAYEDDGLGYYPDGAKRTLTDVQIAIFRNSEVQELLKAKRRAALAAAAAANRKRRRSRTSPSPTPEEIPPSPETAPAPVSRAEAHQNRLNAALWASKHTWDEFGNPVEVADKPTEFIAEVQVIKKIKKDGNTEEMETEGKTFFWPKVIPGEMTE